MNRLFLKVKAKYYKMMSQLQGQVVYRDKYGLKYFLWNDTRLESTILQGSRTDDEGVILWINRLLDQYRSRQENPYDKPIVAIDVGAFIGIISLAMAKKLWPQDRVYAFEPSDRNFQRLCQNIQLNNKQHIIQPIHSGVLHQKKEKAYLKLMDRPGENHIVEDIGKNSDGQYNVFSAIALDDFCREKEIERIHILKIDTEGSDAKVLEGAWSLLQQGRIDFIFAECEEPDTDNFKVMKKILLDQHYQIYYIVRHHEKLVRTLKESSRFNKKPPMNMLAVSPKTPFDLPELEAISAAH